MPHSLRQRDERQHIGAQYLWESLGDIVDEIITDVGSDSLIEKRAYIRNASWIAYHKKKQISMTASGLRFKSLGITIGFEDSFIGTYDEYSKSNQALSAEDYIKILEFIGGTSLQQAEFFREVLDMKGEYWTSTVASSMTGIYGKIISIGELVTFGFSSKDDTLLGRKTV